MYDHMSVKDVGGIDTIHGSIENIPYSLFYMKQLDYLINIISNYAVLLVTFGKKIQQGYGGIINHGEEKNFQVS